MDDKENLLDQYRQALGRTAEPEDLAVSAGPGSDAYDIDLSLQDDIYIDTSMTSPSFGFSDIQNYPSVTISGSGGTSNSIYAPNNATLTTSIDWNDLVIGQSNTNAAGKMSLNGKNADIEINGVSLCDTIRGIQDRLNILCPDTSMEAEWDELRELREQYEAKLQECREKSKMWKSLKNGS